MTTYNELTPAEKLEQVGKTQVITSSTAFGATEVETLHRGEWEAEELDLVTSEVLPTAEAGSSVTIEAAQPVTSVTDDYKIEGRFMATKEAQIDVNGLGYQYTSTDPEFES